MKITPDIVLQAYTSGVFPMSDGRDENEIFWVDPEHRGILPLNNFHLPRRLHRIVRSDRFQISTDTAFEEVIEACAEPASGRWTTWINHEIQEQFLELHERGFAHSLETWSNNELVGGLYGIGLGGAFFGESMFSRENNASKVALVHLVGRLKLGGFKLLDTQFVTTHLHQFGVVEISREAYHSRLAAALSIAGDFNRSGPSLSTTAVLQSITQTS